MGLRRVLYVGPLRSTLRVGGHSFSRARIPGVISGQKNLHILVIFAVILIVGSSLSSLVFADNEKPSREIGITEKAGQYVPLGLVFRDENGMVLRLKELVNKPTILALVYYTCDRICPQMLGGLAEVIPKVNLVPGRDYMVVTISFDDADMYEVAAQKKDNYIKALNQAFPRVAWRFLTGDKENIQKITNSVGFSFRKEEHGFSHPTALIILSPEGKITRYIYFSKYQYGGSYPVNFSPVELEAALTDASRGKVSRSIRQAIAYCFPHGSKELERFFTILAIVGTATLLCVVALFVYLRTSSKKSHEERGNDSGS